MLPHVRGDGALASSRTHTHTHTHIYLPSKSFGLCLDLAFKEMQLSDALDSIAASSAWLAPMREVLDLGLVA